MSFDDEQYFNDKSNGLSGTPAPTQPPEGLDELNLKSEIFNALGIFDLELSAKSPDGTKFWLDCKRAIDAHTREAVLKGRIDELENLANHYYHPVLELYKAREALTIGLFDRLDELKKEQGK